MSSVLFGSACRCLKQVAFTFAKRYSKLVRSMREYRRAEQHFGITSGHVAIVFSTPAGQLVF